MGTQRATSLTANATLVYSDEFVQDFTSHVDMNIPEFSTYLVRSAVVVPIPQ